jgi:hypothetical protein
MSEAHEGMDYAGATTPSPALKITPLVFFAIAGALLLTFVDPYRYYAPLNAPMRVVSLFLIAIPCIPALRWLDKYVTERHALSSDFMTCAGCGLAIGLFVRTTGTFHLGGADHSTLVDAGWRLLNGQELYRSFYGPLPPSFAISSELAYRLGGVSWQSLVDYESLCAAGIAMACYALFRAIGLSPTFAAFASLAHVFATHGQCGYPWYNATAVSASALTLLSFLALLRSRHKMTFATALAAAIALALLSKPNGLPLALGAIPLTMLAPRHAIGGLFVGLLAATIFLLALHCGHVDLEAMVHAYAAVAGSRGNLLSHKAFQDLGYSEQACTYLVAAALTGCAVWHTAAEWRRAPDRTTLCCIAAILLAVAVGGIYVQTNMELKTNDLALMFVAAATGLSSKSRTSGPQNPASSRPAVLQDHLRTTTTLVLGLVLLFSGALAGWQRVRVYAIGDQMFFQRGPTVRLTSPPFFADMHASPRLASIVDEVQRTLDRIPAESWFFGPRMQFCYAAFARKSLKGLPIAWDAGTMYPASEEPNILERWRELRPDVLIFLRNDISGLLQGGQEIPPATLALLSTDTTYMPVAILKEIGGGYVLLEMSDVKNITVLIRADLAAGMQGRTPAP